MIATCFVSHCSHSHFFVSFESHLHAGEVAICANFSAVAFARVHAQNMLLQQLHACTPRNSYLHARGLVENCHTLQYGPQSTSVL